MPGCRSCSSADEEEFAAAVAEIDTRLRAEIRERQEHRERIARLAAGDSLALPPEAVAYLDRLRELGVPERMVEGERDAWILIAAHSPERMAKWMALKREQLEDPEVVELYRRLCDMIDWQPDDPRLPELADWLAAVFGRRRLGGLRRRRRRLAARVRRAPRLDVRRRCAGGPAADGAAGGARLVRLDRAGADRQPKAAASAHRGSRKEDS